MSQDPLINYLTENRKSVSQDFFKEKKLYKEYFRSESIKLPEATPIQKSLSDLLLSRESRREFGEGDISIDDLSSILFWSAGAVPRAKDNTVRRMQPSGGAKYPVEIYVAVLKAGAVQKGVYHYNVKNHSLENLPTTDEIDILNCLPTHDEFAKQGQFLILFSFVKNRSFRKYGALAYKLAFIESGHISQNMYLITEALGHSCCGMGTSEGGSYDEVLNLNEAEESIFYALVLGARSK